MNLKNFEKMLNEDYRDYIDISSMIKNSNNGIAFRRAVPSSKITYIPLGDHSVPSSVELIGAALGDTLLGVDGTNISTNPILNANELLNNFCLIGNDLIFYIKDWNWNGSMLYLKRKDLAISEDENFVYATCNYDLYVTPNITHGQLEKLEPLKSDNSGYVKLLKSINKTATQTRYTNNIGSWEEYERIIKYLLNDSNLLNKLEVWMVNEKNPSIQNVCTGSLAINKKFMVGKLEKPNFGNDTFLNAKGQHLVENRNWLMSSLNTTAVRLGGWKQLANRTCKQQFHFDNIKNKSSHRLTYEIELDIDNPAGLNQLLVQMVSDKHSAKELLQLTKERLIVNKYETHESLDLMGDKILNKEWDSKLPRHTLDNLGSRMLMKENGENNSLNLVRIDDASESNTGDNLFKIAKLTDDGVFQIESLSPIILRNKNKKSVLPAGKYVLTLDKKPDLIEYLGTIPEILEGIESEIKKSRLSGTTINMEINTKRVVKHSKRTLSSFGDKRNIDSDKTKKRILSKKDED